MIELIFAKAIIYGEFENVRAFIKVEVLIRMGGIKDVNSSKN